MGGGRARRGRGGGGEGVHGPVLARTAVVRPPALFTAPVSRRCGLPVLFLP